MKKSTKKLLLTIFSVIILATCLAITSFAANSDISFKANSDDNNTVITTQTGKNGKTYLFLPSSADLANLVLDFDAEALEITADKGTVTIASGEAFDLTAICTAKNGEYTVTFADGSTLIIMKSANIRALFYVSEDPENKGRPWVETSKNNKAKGNMSIVSVDGNVDHTDKVTELKGRGNSTFADYKKKPYQMKIDTKTALIAGSSEKSKKWVLLANAADFSLLHNSVTFTLAEMLGLDYTTPFEPVDFYYDGEYRGSYLITEKVEVDSSRVDIDDLDGRIEDLNEDTPAYENPVVVTKTTASKGATDAAVNSKGSYKYVDGLIEPELPEGASHHAYLLEPDYIKRYTAEQTGFMTNRGQGVVTKNPEYLTKESGAFIAAFWQEFEDAVYSTNGYNTKTGKYYYEYCDLDSLVKLYLINELGKNYDSFGSSTFFYLPEDSDIMYAGPVWDYDICYGIGHRNRPVASNPENFFAATKYLINGLVKIQSFRDALKKTMTPGSGEFYNTAAKLIGDNGIIAKQAATIYASQKMNYKVWDIYAKDYYTYNYEAGGYRIVVKEGKVENYDNSVEFFNYFVEERLNWLSDQITSWNGNNYSIPTDKKEEPQKELSFFEKIIAFFKSIIDWIMNLFKF